MTGTLYVGDRTGIPNHDCGSVGDASGPARIAVTDEPTSLRVGRIGTERLADHTVVRVVKAGARRVGLDPKLFAGHSLRSGFLTSAAGRGASIFKMMDVSRHKSMDTLRAYVRDAELFRDHAGAGLL